MPVESTHMLCRQPEATLVMRAASSGIATLVGSHLLISSSMSGMPQHGPRQACMGHDWQAALQGWTDQAI